MATRQLNVVLKFHIIVTFLPEGFCNIHVKPVPPEKRRTHTLKIQTLIWDTATHTYTLASWMNNKMLMLKLWAPSVGGLLQLHQRGGTLGTGSHLLKLEVKAVRSWSRCRSRTRTSRPHPGPGWGLGPRSVDQDQVQARVCRPGPGSVDWDQVQDLQWSPQQKHTTAGRNREISKLAILLLLFIMIIIF